MEEKKRKKTPDVSKHVLQISVSEEGRARNFSPVSTNERREGPAPQHGSGYMAVVIHDLMTTGNNAVWRRHII